jgi:acyl-CoA synthetase (AMP-forming)/AMP-acid ligase II
MTAWHLAERTATHPLLGGEPGAIAVVDGETSLTYADLARRVEDRGAELGATRRLVLLEAGNDLETVVTYLAALGGSHPVLLVAPGDAARRPGLVDRYLPDVVQAAGGTLEVRHPGSRHDLHPDLALLMSTSGSTGSPKLVRLTLTNVVENARSIATYLGIRDTDRAITSLPLHYCYGLSVLNSHLLSGARVVLTNLSVADECFWDLADRAGATSLAGVPYTFDLLDASGFSARDLPSLRYVTQAGGRMDPARVRDYALLGRSRSWDLVVMYGQTEATARMAYLPTDLAAERPEAVGIPIPGGSFRLAPVHRADGEAAEHGVGELLYTGPNVMMGYAETPADLALGSTLSELHTGDLARQADDGLWEIVGRLGRQAKLFGLRLDLDHVERALADVGRPARLVVRGDRLWAFVDRPRVVDRTRTAVLAHTGLPASAVRVVRLDQVPRTPSGKPDRAALVAHVDRVLADVESDETAGPATAAGIRDLFAVLLGRPDASTRDSFVDLGGDSLSYVEATTRLGRVLGTLPPGWQRLSPEQLAGTRQRPRRFTVPVDLSVALRAVAATLILVSHADIAQLQGGAHVLLAVAGYNLARFQLGVPGRLARVRAIARTALAVAVPAGLWIAAVIVVAGTYRWQTALFLNGATGPDHWTHDWQFWFLETLAWGYVAVAALLAVPRVDRWQRRRPFAAAMTVLTACLAVRYALVGVEAGPVERYSFAVVLWCIGLGWAAAVARTRWQRFAVAVVTLATTIGFFDDGRREAIVVTGVLLLLVDRAVPLPKIVAVPLQTVAVASLWIYLTQWQVYPRFEDAGHPYAAVLAAIVVGIAARAGYVRVSAPLGRAAPRLGLRTIARTAP